MCNGCLSEDKIKSTTTFTVEYYGSSIVINNVPCLECNVCGEKTFSTKVSAQLEDIVDSVKPRLNDDVVIDFAEVG